MTDHTPAEVIDHDSLAVRIGEGGVIVADFEALTVYVDTQLEDYRGVTIDRKYYKQAKNDRASINNLFKTLDQQRKSIKDAVMREYNAFEGNLRPILDEIKAVSGEIDVQIKRIEEEEKAEKRAQLLEHYRDFGGVLADAVDFELILDPKWLNMSTGIMVGKAGVEAAVDKIATDEHTLSELNLAHPIEAKAEYFATLDMSKAIARSKALEEQLRRAEALEAEKQAILAERKAAEEAPVVAAPAPEPAVVATETPEPAQEPVAQLWRFEVTCTREELDSIIAHIKGMGLTGKASR